MHLATPTQGFFFFLHTRHNSNTLKCSCGQPLYRFNKQDILPPIDLEE